MLMRLWRVVSPITLTSSPKQYQLSHGQRQVMSSNQGGTTASHEPSQVLDSNSDVMAQLIQPLKLVKLDHTQIAGIYGSSGKAFARRMAYLHPSAAEGFLELLDTYGEDLVLSDMFRSATASLNRKYPKGRLPRRGVAKPAFSAHNYGLAIDVAVDRTLQNLQVSKSVLDMMLADSGWYCHRRDSKRGSEDWHYNYLGKIPGLLPKEKRTSSAIERHIHARYSRAWKLGPHSVQACLRVCGLYDGDLDGKIGPLSTSAIKAFQRAWRLSADGKAGPTTCRVLWYRAAELRSPAYSKTG